MKLSSLAARNLAFCTCITLIVSGCSSTEIKNAALGTGVAVGVATGITCMVVTFGIGNPLCSVAFTAAGEVGKLASEELYEALLLEEEKEDFKKAVDESLKTDNKATWRSNVRPDVKVDIEPQTPIEKFPSKETKQETTTRNTEPAHYTNQSAKNVPTKDEICKTAKFVYYIGEKVEEKSNYFCLEDGRWIERS